MSSSVPSQRQRRVGEQLRHVVAETLQRGHFDSAVLLDHAAGVSVSEVRISPDLKNATAYIVTLGGQKTPEILEALNESAFYFQKEIGRKLGLKFTPRLRFMSDYSFDEAQKIEKILSSLPEHKQDEG